MNRLIELGIFYWKFRVEDNEERIREGYHGHVPRMAGSHVPNTIKEPETFHKDGLEYIKCPKPFFYAGCYIDHPDAKRVRIEANIECVGTAMLWQFETLAVAWGDTPEEAVDNMVKRIMAPANYSPCPLCRATRCDLDFEPEGHEVVCRLCGHRRDAQ